MAGVIEISYSIARWVKLIQELAGFFSKMHFHYRQNLCKLGGSARAKDWSSHPGLILDPQQGKFGSIVSGWVSRRWCPIPS